MASEMLKAVLETEKECSEKEALAQKQAETDKIEAKKKAAALVEEAQIQADKMLEENEKSLNEKAASERQEALKETEKQCAELSANAEKNIGNVTKLAIELLCS